MKKKLFITMISCCFIYNLFAQITVANVGLHVKQNTILSIDSLTIVPSADMEISNNSLTHRHTPVPGSPNASVLRVYEWQTPLEINGELQIFVPDEELNGNTFSLLQLAYSAVAGNTGFITSSTSITEENNKLVRDNWGTVVIKQLTAVNNNSLLPVQWLSFTATKSNEQAILRWQIAQEQNVKEYVVQKSADGISYQDIAALPATCNGCGLSSIVYSYTDFHPFTGNNYYRIKEIDYDGFTDYTDIRHLQFTESIAIRVGPNPASHYFDIIGLKTSGKYQIELLSSNGAVVAKTTTEGNAVYKMHVSHLPSGNYVLNIRYNDAQFTKKIIIVN